MSFVRPEAQRVLHQWRDAIIGGVAVAIGAYWSFSTGPILRWVAVLMIVGGGAVLWNGIRRARLPRAGGGAGVVQVDERQITYLAAEQGGIISIDDLIRVEIHANGKGFDWLFQTAGMALLRIPGNAEGAVMGNRTWYHRIVPGRSNFSRLVDPRPLRAVPCNQGAQLQGL